MVKHLMLSERAEELAAGLKTLMLAYLRFGIRSAMPVIPAMMLLWEIMTPLGMPVEPLVYMMTAMSEGSGCLRSTATVDEQSADHYAGNGSQTTHNICCNYKVIMKKGWISVCNQYRFYQLYTLNQTSQNSLNGFRITTFLLEKDIL